MHQKQRSRFQKIFQGKKPPDSAFDGAASRRGRGARPVCLLVLRGGKGREGEEDREGGNGKRRGREGKGRGGEREGGKGREGKGT